MDRRSMTLTEKSALMAALRGNAQENRPLYMGADTSAVDEVPESEAIDAIKSVPVHYADDTDWRNQKPTARSY